MSVQRLAAACIWPGFPGHEAPDWLLRWLEQGVGGVVLFAHNVRDDEQLDTLTASLGDVVIAIDEEGGDVTRLDSERGSSYPGALALGVIDDVGVTRSIAAAIAGRLARAGVTMNLAPVADVNTNPENPVIGVRSYGSDPSLVARHVAAFVEGTQARGVAACAKHFPGHGNTHADSHLELPETEHSELEPFRAAIGAGVAAIMTAHVVVRELDSAPATLSRRAITGVLRGELGFDGLVVTDALEMRAVAATVGIEEAAVRALDAGADALCLGRDLDGADVERVRAAIVAAVAEGRLAEERLAEAAARVARRIPRANTTPSRAKRTAGEDAAARALRVRGRIRLASAPLVVELAPEPSIAAGDVPFRLGDALRGRWPDAQVVRVHGPSANGLGAWTARPLVIEVRDAARHPWEREIVDQLLASRPDAVVVETGLPGWEPAGARGYLATHGAGRASLEAAADALAG